MDLGTGRDTDTPAITTARYVAHGAPASTPVSITIPASGGTVEGATTTVAGTAAPGARVDIEAQDTSTGAAATTPAGATGYAQTSVTGDVPGGTAVLSVTDPAGDDNGPGTFQYPTSSDYVPGSWDLTGFQVITRDYSIAPGGAWSERLEIQGFAAPVWVGPAGDQVGTPTAVVASTAAKTITIALPEAEFGTPASGWTFTVAMTGQNGFSADQAIAFTANPGAFTLGVCPAGGTGPICALSPSTVPEVMDTITPPGVAQDTELDPTRGPVVLQGVTVP